MRHFDGNSNGGRGRIRTDERMKRMDLQSTSFSHLDTLPTKKNNLLSQAIEASRLSLKLFIFKACLLGSILKNESNAFIPQ